MAAACLQDQSFASLFCAASIAVQDAKTKLISAVSSGDVKAQKEAVDWFCSAPEPKLAAAARLSAQSKFHTHLTETQICELPDMLDLKATCDERVRLYARDKGFGAFRTILGVQSRHLVDRIDDESVWL